MTSHDVQSSSGGDSTDTQIVAETQNTAEDPDTVTPRDVKDVVEELLRNGYVEERHKPALFRLAVSRQTFLETVLEPLDLSLRLDEHRGVAFLTVARSAYAGDDGQDTWSHPLVRRQRLTLEQSLLIAILRQSFVLHEQEAGVGGPPAKNAVEDLLAQFPMYFEDSGSDAKNESRLSNLLDQLKSYGVVSEVDNNDEFFIRPLIAHLANPQSLTALVNALQEKARDAALPSVSA
jgi:hypothetical protein